MKHQVRAEIKQTLSLRIKNGILIFGERKLGRRCVIGYPTDISIMMRIIDYPLTMLNPIIQSIVYFFIFHALVED